MREKIYNVIEPDLDGNGLSRIYDVFMMLMIIISLVPLTIKGQYSIFVFTDAVCVSIFILDYIFRWLTADYRFKSDKKLVDFIRYPFSIMAIIDLLSILPSLTILSSSFKMLRLLRMIKTFRVFRVFKAFRYSKNIQIITNVVKNSKDSLIAVGVFAILYVLVSALVIFNIEPQTFASYFDAIYWAVVSLTTVGYGDIYPVSNAGRIITILSSVFGVAIIALPSGIIAGEYMKEIDK